MFGQMRIGETCVVAIPRASALLCLGVPPTLASLGGLTQAQVDARIARRVGKGDLVARTTNALPASSEAVATGLTAVRWTLQSGRPSFVGSSTSDLILSYTNANLDEWSGYRGLIFEMWTAATGGSRRSVPLYMPFGVFETVIPQPTPDLYIALPGTGSDIGIYQYDSAASNQLGFQLTIGRAPFSGGNYIRVYMWLA